MNTKFLCLGFVMAATCFAPVNGTLHAQDAVRQPDGNTGVSPGTTGTVVGESGAVIVTGVPPDESFLPTARPISSVYGTDMDIVDIPRDVSTITKEQVDFRQITSVDDLGQFASGTYTASIFGAEGLPQIRGVPAEIYQNGQREHYYLNSLPPSFNGVESIDVVKGPGTAVYGPASQGLGGYINLVTKQPFFDGQHTEITDIFGDLYGGGDSYFRDQWQIDNSGPLIKDKLAYRISYLGRDSGGYYRNVKDNTQDVFVALTYLPTTNLSISLTGQYYEDKFNEDAGFNRVTQNLIDNHIYISGPIIPSYAPFVGVVDPGPDGSYANQEVKLHNDQVLVSQPDSAAGSRGLGQMIVTLTLDGLTIKNSTFGDTVESRKFSAYGYDEYAPSNISVENRTEFQFSLKAPIIPAHDVAVVKDKDGKDVKDAKAETGHSSGWYIDNHFDTGFSFRYEHELNYSAFVNEPFAVYDISGAGPTPVFPRKVIFGPERTIPDMPGYYATNVFDTADITDYYQGGVFLQDQVDFTSFLTGIFGVRCDFIAAQSGAPALGPLVDPTLTDGIGNPADDLAATKRDTTLIANGSYFASLTYKPIKPVGIYLTYDRVNGTDSADNQGALPFAREANNVTRVTANSLRELSELYEGGMKFSLLHDTLFLSAAGYHQTRDQTDQRGNVFAIVARGADVDMTYQPNKNFSVTSNFTWQAANYQASEPFSQTSSYLDMFAAGVNVDGHDGTGIGSPNYETYPKGNYRLPDVPNILFNAYFIAQTDSGFGIGIGPQVTGDVIVNDTTGDQPTLTIPAQVTWNGFLFYRKKNYEVRLSFFNILNARNWTPPATFANNDLIYPDEPFHMNMTVKLRF